MPLSVPQRAAIGARAATLWERLAEVSQSRAARSFVDAEPPPARALSAWVRAFSPGDPRALDRRLGWEGLDRTTAAWALSEAPARPAGEPPSWTRWLVRFLEEAEALGHELTAGRRVAELEPPAASSAGPPFVELWLPVVRAARAALAGSHGPALRAVAAGALDDLERQLIGEVAACGELALYERFRGVRDAAIAGASDPPAREGCYRRFVQAMLGGQLAAFFQEYPVLARHLALLAGTWVRSSGELLDRLAADRSAIAAVFGGGRDPGRLVSVDTGLSDRHHGGRRVAALAFESGLRLVYKPRDVGLERAYSGFVAWLLERGFRPRLRSLRVLEREGYGWVEFVSPFRFRSKDQVREYYRRAGALLCIAYVLRGSDLHAENVIASADGPVLVDAETLLQPVLSSDAAADGPASAALRVRESCLGSGLVTVLRATPDGELHDMGGLDGDVGGALPPRLGRRVWKSLRSDDLHYMPGGETPSRLQNAVYLDGIRQRPEQYVEELVAGFTEAFRFLMKNRNTILAPGGPLSLFASRRVRMVFRDSSQYGALLYLLAQPKYQRSGFVRSFAIDSLNRVFNCELARPLLWPLVVEERQALEGLDVPHFSIGTNSVQLVTKDGEVIPGCLRCSGLDAVRQRFETLSEAGLDRQVEILRWALANATDSGFRSELVSASPGPGERSGPDSTLLPYALWVGTELLARAARPSGGGLAWPQPAFLWLAAPGAPLSRLALYEGAAGVALFFAALAAVSGEDRWLEATRRASSPLGAALEAPEPGLSLYEAGLGGCDGIGSIVYALTWIGRLTGERSYTALADRAARYVSAERIAAEAVFDIVGGLAGLILGLLALYRDVEDERILELAVRAGRRLVEAQVETEDGGGAWPAPGGALIGGFAHGAAGIAYSLVELFRVAGHEVFLAAAARAFRYERSLYSAAKGNWRLVRKGSRRPGDPPDWMVAWCHGAPGVGLARALCYEEVGDDEVLQEISVAMATTSRSRLSTVDHLCCGNLGRGDALLTVGRRLREPGYIASADAIVDRVVARARRAGHFMLPSTPFDRRIFAPGFFQGLAGIGYQVLRTAVPSLLPSVLAFQTKPLARAE